MPSPAGRSTSISGPQQRWFPICKLASRSRRWGGVHAGCYELFAHEPIQTISDLKGHSVSVRRLNSGGYLQARDHGGARGSRSPEGYRMGGRVPSGSAHGAVRRVERSLPSSPFPPSRRSCAPARSVASSSAPPRTSPGRSIFAASIEGNRPWVRDHPIATKRFLRALFRGADLCARSARNRRAAVWSMPVSRSGMTTRSRRWPSCRTGTWREFDPEEAGSGSTRCGVHEVGFISASPNALLAAGTDWRFFNEIKRELKA